MSTSQYTIAELRRMIQETISVSNSVIQGSRAAITTTPPPTAMVASAPASPSPPVASPPASSLPTTTEATPPRPAAAPHTADDLVHTPPARCSTVCLAHNTGDINAKAEVPAVPVHSTASPSPILVLPATVEASPAKPCSWVGTPPPKPPDNSFTVCATGIAIPELLHAENLVGAAFSQNSCVARFSGTVAQKGQFDYLHESLDILKKILKKPGVASEDLVFTALLYWEQGDVSPRKNAVYNSWYDKLSSFSLRRYKTMELMPSHTIVKLGNVGLFDFQVQCVSTCALVYIWDPGVYGNKCLVCSYCHQQLMVPSLYGSWWNFSGFLEFGQLQGVRSASSLITELWSVSRTLQTVQNIQFWVAISCNKQLQPPSFCQAVELKLWPSLKLKLLVTILQCYGDFSDYETAVLGWFYDGCVSSSEDRTCKIWSLSEGRMLRSISFPAIIDSVALDPRSHIFYAGGRDGKLYITAMGVDVSSQGSDDSSILGALDDHSKAVTTLTSRTDGFLLISGSEDGNVQVWDTRTQQATRKFKHSQGPVTNVLIVTPKRVNLQPLCKVCAEKREVEPQVFGTSIHSYPGMFTITLTIPWDPGVVARDGLSWFVAKRSSGDTELVVMNDRVTLATYQIEQCCCLGYDVVSLVKHQARLQPNSSSNHGWAAGVGDVAGNFSMTCTLRPLERSKHAEIFYTSMPWDPGVIAKYWLMVRAQCQIAVVRPFQRARATPYIVLSLQRVFMFGSTTAENYAPGWKCPHIAARVPWDPGVIVWQWWLDVLCPRYVSPWSNSMQQLMWNSHLQVLFVAQDADIAMVGSINLSNAWTGQLSESTVGNIQLALGTQASISVGWQKYVDPGRYNITELSQYKGPSIAIMQFLQVTDSERSWDKLRNYMSDACHGTTEIFLPYTISELVCFQLCTIMLPADRTIGGSVNFPWIIAWGLRESCSNMVANKFGPSKFSHGAPVIAYFDFGVQSYYLITVTTSAMGANSVSTDLLVQCYCSSSRLVESLKHAHPYIQYNADNVQQSALTWLSTAEAHIFRADILRDITTEDLHMHLWLRFSGNSLIGSICLGFYYFQHYVQLAQVLYLVQAYQFCNMAEKTWDPRGIYKMSFASFVGIGLKLLNYDTDFGDHLPYA